MKKIDGLISDLNNRAKDEGWNAWKDIPGWEGFYQMTPSGMVRSVDRIVTRKSDGAEVLKKGKQLVISQRPDYQEKGYEERFVKLSKDGKPKSIAVAALLKKTFHMSPEKAQNVAVKIITNYQGPKVRFSP